MMKKFKAIDFVFLLYDIEDFLRKQKTTTKRKAWKNLVKEFKYEEFYEILCYLRESNKVKFISKDKIKWIFQPLCDYDGKCPNKAYKEVYPSFLGGKYKNKGWSHLCKKHFYHEQKRFNKKLPNASVY